MTGPASKNTITRRIAGKLRQEGFTLLDVGCSGGIHPGWREFGDKLTAVGFDPNIEEVERLRAKESLPGVSYEAAFVGVPQDHPLARQRAGRSFVGRSPWDRLSVARTIALREESLKRADNKALTEINAWPRTRLAANPPVFLPEFIAARGLADIDFVKIDIDGGDLIVLRSLFESPAHPSVLGFLLEVNFHGSDDESEHTLHNTDRLMRRMGYDLFDLSVRRYSSSALPLRYEYDMPAQTLGGRPFQGDALYLRDLCAPEMSAYASGLSADKIAKAVAVFSLCGLHDQAAEIVLRFRDRLSAILAPDAVLEMLAKEVQAESAAPLSYRDYMAAFERDDAMFYPPRAAAPGPVDPERPPSTERPARRKPRKPLAKRIAKWLRRRLAR